jgi:hypothetical protein
MSDIKSPVSFALRVTGHFVIPTEARNLVFLLTRGENLDPSPHSG